MMKYDLVIAGGGAAGLAAAASFIEERVSTYVCISNVVMLSKS